MKSFSLFVLFLLLSFGAVKSQSIEKLEEVAFLRAQDLSSKLGLNYEKSIYLEKVLYKHYKRVHELDFESKEFKKSIGAQYSEVKEIRDKELRAFFSEQQMILFNLIEKSIVEDTRDYYLMASENLELDSDFFDEITIYSNNIQGPVISKCKNSLNKHIEKIDSIELKELRVLFNYVLDDAIGNAQSKINLEDLKLGKVIKTLGESNPEYVEVWNRIKKISKKYSDEIEMEYTDIRENSKDWSRGSNAIIDKYLLDDDPEDFKQIFYTFTDLGATENVNRYVFLLYDESNLNTYFELKYKIQQLFIKVLKY